MYTLRKVTKKGIEMNIGLGNSFTLILKETSPEEFKRIDEEIFKELDFEGCYGFISKESGSEVFPLFNNQKNYIVCSNGQTYQNVSYK